MIKKLKERIKFRRRRRLEKKLKKYANKYIYLVAGHEKELTNEELKHIMDIAYCCYIGMFRIFVAVNLEFEIRSVIGSIFINIDKTGK